MPNIILIVLFALLTGLSRLPLYSGWLSFIALLPLLYYFQNEHKPFKQLLMHALVFSAVNNLLWMHWIWRVTAPGFVGIILLFALYYVVLFAGLQYVWERMPKVRYLSFIIAFIMLEYLQNFGDFCFPWVNLGYALSDYSLLIQAADIGGVGFLSLLILLINVLIFLVIKGKWHYGIGIILIFLLWIGYGVWCNKSIILEKQTAKIAVMQPSIPQEQKWESQHFNELYKRYYNLTAKAAKDSAGLIIWPEAAMPVYLLRDPGYQPLVQNLSDKYAIDIFTGFPDVLPAPPSYPGGAFYYNAATLFKPNTEPEEPFYKILLVPVGERMPWLKVLPLMWKLQFGQANWEYGTQTKYYQSQGAVFSPQICFEIAFPELNQKMAFRNLALQNGCFTCPLQKTLPSSLSRLKSQPQKIDFLVNITNDAWFGRSSGPWIHGMLTRFRAVENRIQIYRSANTGISMAVDPLGKIIHNTGLYQQTQFQAPLYTAKRIPLYYYLAGWERLFCLLGVILFVLALPDVKFPKSHKSKREVKL